MSVAEFVRQRNIDNYRRLLGKDASVEVRKVLLRLLAEEERKEAPTPRAASNDD